MIKLAIQHSHMRCACQFVVVWQLLVVGVAISNVSKIVSAKTLFMYVIQLLWSSLRLPLYLDYRSTRQLVLLCFCA